MTLAYPNKYIRKAVYDLVNNITVNSNNIKCYDTYVTGATPSYYILLTSPTNRVLETVKCGDRWDSSILIDVVTRYQKSGNPGSSLLADDIAAAIVTLLDPTLTLGGSLNVVHQKISDTYNISTVGDTENVFRTLIRLELVIN